MVLDPNAESFDEYVRANTDSVDPDILRDVMNGSPDFKLSRFVMTGGASHNLSDVTETTWKIKGHFAGNRSMFPDVFVRVSDWEGTDKYEDIAQMRVGSIAQVGPDAHLVRSWKPWDGPLAVMDYEVVEEIEPGAFRLEARPS